MNRKQRLLYLLPGFQVVVLLLFLSLALCQISESTDANFYFIIQTFLGFIVCFCLIYQWVHKIKRQLPITKEQAIVHLLVDIYVLIVIVVFLVHNK